MAEYYFAGSTDLGYKRTVNEDYMNVVQLSNDCIFAVIADGMGSLPSDLQPANIVCTDLCDAVRDIYNNDPDFLLDNAEQILHMLVRNTNRVIGAFKKANEELYAGFGSTVTCCLFAPDHNMTLAHVGNSRLYMIRNVRGAPNIKSLTTDHTKAKELLAQGIIADEEYYTHPERGKLTSCLGFVTDPTIQIMSAPIKKEDIFFLTTDGIHCAVRPEAMLEIVLRSDNCKTAVDNLIFAAKSQEYPDNMSSIVIFVQ